MYKPTFDTAHSFEHVRDEHERTLWFQGRDAHLVDFAEIERHDSMNDESARRSLKDLRPDVIVVFGTGKLSPEVIDVCSRGIVNLHGGDPEAYRGLDTHLWAIYHGDFGALVSTLHRLAPALDRGDIIASLPIRIVRRMRLFELRAANTDVCVQLVQLALVAHRHQGTFVSRPQRCPGRYYSFMPGVLKEICVRKFESYSETVQ